MAWTLVHGLCSQQAVQTRRTAWNASGRGPGRIVCAMQCSAVQCMSMSMMHRRMTRMRAVGRDGNHGKWKQGMSGEPRGNIDGIKPAGKHKQLVRRAMSNAHPGQVRAVVLACHGSHDMTDRLMRLITDKRPSVSRGERAPFSGLSGCQGVGIGADAAIRGEIAWRRTSRLGRYETARPR